MKKFVQEYGFTIIVAVALIVLIAICSPIGQLVKNNVTSIADNFASKTLAILNSTPETINIDDTDEEPKETILYGYATALTYSNDYDTTIPSIELSDGNTVNHYISKTQYQVSYNSTSTSLGDEQWLWYDNTGGCTSSGTHYWEYSVPSDIKITRILIYNATQYPDAYSKIYGKKVGSDSYEFIVDGNRTGANKYWANGEYYAFRIEHTGISKSSEVYRTQIDIYGKKIITTTTSGVTDWQDSDLAPSGKTKVSSEQRTVYASVATWSDVTTCGSTLDELNNCGVKTNATTKALKSTDNGLTWEEIYIS